MTVGIAPQEIGDHRSELEPVYETIGIDLLKSATITQQVTHIVIKADDRQSVLDHIDNRTSDWEGIEIGLQPLFQAFPKFRINREIDAQLSSVQIPSGKASAGVRDLH